MSADLPDVDKVFPIGTTCVSAARAFFSFNGAVDRTRGAVEFSWNGGRVTTIDTHADWTLKVVDEPWHDAFSDTRSEEVAEVERDFGIWIREPISPSEPLACTLGSTLSRVQWRVDEFAQLMGVVLFFGSCSIVVESFGGEVRVRRRRDSPRVMTAQEESR